MYVGPGSLEDLLAWFKTANEITLCLFLGGGYNDSAFLRAVFDARDSLDIASSLDVAILLQYSAGTPEKLAAFRVPGNHHHILPFYSNIRTSESRRYFDWDRDRLGYDPILANELSDEIRQEVIKSTIQFTNHVSKHFKLTPADLPGLLVLPKSGDRLGEHLVFRTNDRFTIKEFFELIRDLRYAPSPANQLVPLPSQTVAGRSLEKLRRKQEEEKTVAEKIETALEQLSVELSSFQWRTSYSDELVTLNADSWSETAPDFYSSLSAFATQSLSADEFERFCKATRVTSLCNRLKRLYAHARKTRAIIERRSEVKSKPWGFSSIPQAVKYEAVAEVLRKHQAFLTASSVPAEEAARIMVNASTCLDHYELLESTTQSRLDLLVVIALREELTEFGELIPLKSKWSQQLLCYLHYFDGPRGASKNYRGAVVCLEGMGAERASAATAQVILQHHPRLATSIGIAGGLSNHVSLGSVVVGDQIDGYIVEARVEGVAGYRLRNYLNTVMQR
jgi:hypothetical protein